MSIIPFPTRRTLPGISPRITNAKQPVKPLDTVIRDTGIPACSSTPTRKELIRRGLLALSDLKDFMGTRQMKTVAEIIRTGEESQWFVERMESLAAIVESMPKTYETDGQGDDAICHLHYFGGSYDGYLIEKDMEESADPAEAQWQAFGFVHWAHMPGDADKGYICLPEIFKSNMELDFHFDPTPLREIKAKHGLKTEPPASETGIPACSSDPAPPMPECLNSDTQLAFPEVEIKTEYYKGMRGQTGETSIGLWRITTMKRHHGRVTCTAILHEDTGVAGIIMHNMDSKTHHLASSDKTATAKEVRRVHEEGLTKFHELEPAASGASHPLRQSFARTVPGFQATIARLADLTGLDAMVIYRLWRKYSEACSNGDQSSILSEFLQWYRKDLDPTETLDLQAALYDSEN